VASKEAHGKEAAGLVPGGGDSFLTGLAVELVVRLAARSQILTSSSQQISMRELRRGSFGALADPGGDGLGELGDGGCSSGFVGCGGIGRDASERLERVGREGGGNDGLGETPLWAIGAGPRCRGRGSRPTPALSTCEARFELLYWAGLRGLFGRTGQYPLWKTWLTNS
jgi:hypothetical protein